MWPHSGDERKLIAVAKQGRQELESMWARERADLREHGSKWQTPVDEGSAPP